MGPEVSPEEQQQELLKSGVRDLLVPDLALDQIPASP